MMKIIVGKLPTDREMRMISYYRESLIALPVLLGEDEPTEYAILLVDNRIKRPSGGVIEAIALVTFNKGNLTNIIFYDTSDLDSQLQGFASPPTPLSENSNINEYYLREALWSSHFPRAVEEVEWFLEKEAQKDVDGVVMFDMNMLSSILEMTGPVVIDDQRVQGAGLVPALRLGSQNPLNADSYFKEIFTVAINRVIKMDDNRLRTFFSTLVDQLNSKHALLHIDYLTERINSPIFSSTMQGQDCNFENCTSDFVSVSEVEFSRGVAVNKQVDLKISFEEGVLKREVTVFYKNQRGLAKEEEYKSNLLLSTPQETSVSPVTEILSNEQKEREPLLLGYDAYKQALANVSVPPGQTKAYRFRWESGYDLDYSDEGQFRLRIIKQPGEEDYPMNITIEHPDDVLFYNDRFDLTNDGTLHYNTQLSEDIDLIFNW